MMSPIAIVNYSLNSLSLLLACLILFISFTNKLHKNFLSEIMTYILIAEIINSLSKYLSFTWNACFESDIPNRKICTQITEKGNIEILLRIFADMLSITSSVVLSFLSYDTLKNKPQVLSSCTSKIAIRIVLFSFAAICSITLSVLQIVVYQFYPERENFYINQGRCSVMSCSIAADLSLIVIGIVLGFSVSTISISLMNWRHLGRESKRMTNDSKRKNQEELLVKIRKAQWRIMLFPILSSLLFVFYYFDDFVKGIFREKFIEMRRWMNASGIVYAIGNGLRGSVFSFLITFTLSDIWKAIRNFFLCKKEIKEEEAYRKEELA